jgi:hypothetical protein
MNGKKACGIDIDGWQRTDPAEFVHAAGWSTTNHIIEAKSVWLLQQAGTEHGNFKSADEAKRRHAELSGVSPMHR